MQYLIFILFSFVQVLFAFFSSKGIVIDLMPPVSYTKFSRSIDLFLLKSFFYSFIFIILFYLLLRFLFHKKEKWYFYLIGFLILVLIHFITSYLSVQVVY